MCFINNLYLILLNIKIPNDYFLILQIKARLWYPVAWRGAAVATTQVAGAFAFSVLTMTRPAAESLGTPFVALTPPNVSIPSPPPPREKNGSSSTLAAAPVPREEQWFVEVAPANKPRPRASRPSVSKHNPHAGPRWAQGCPKLSMDKISL